MNRSFYNGIAGVKTHQFGIDTWSDNIANQNMYGFKENLPEFQTQFSQALNSAGINTEANDIGLGSSVQRTALDLSQGELVNSDRNFDTAIAGHGWYAFLNNGVRHYTKLGAFYKDVNGDLVNASGEYLLGNVNSTIKPANLSPAQLLSFGQKYAKDGVENVDIFTLDTTEDTPLGDVNSQTKINLPTLLYIPPTPTKNLKFGANLNIGVQSQTDPLTGQEVAESSDHFTASLFNPDGSKNILDMTFTKQFPELQEGSLWNAEFKIVKDVGQQQTGVNYDPNQYLTYPHDNTLYQIVDNAVGSLRFDGSGALTQANIPALSNEGIPITLNLGTPIGTDAPNSGYDGMTAVKGLGRETKFVNNDGKPEGVLEGYVIREDGNIVANFTNGDSASVAKIAIFHFPNEGGLQKINSNMYVESSNSGKAFFYNNGDENVNGDKILTSKLEASNVQLNTALTELIIMQKAFDANAKSITTSDQMIQKAINMKR